MDSLQRHPKQLCLRNCRMISHFKQNSTSAVCLLLPRGWIRLESAAFTSIDRSPQVFSSALVACLMRRRVDAMSRLAYKSLIERFALGCIGAFLISLLETCTIHQRTPHQFLHVVIIGWWRTICTKRLGIIFDDVFVPRE